MNDQMNRVIQANIEIIVGVPPGWNGSHGSKPVLISVILLTTISNGWLLV